MNIENLKKSQSLIALLVLCIIISVLSDKFLQANNLFNVLRQISVNICISLAMTLVVLMAGIDLSVGSVLAFTAMASVSLFQTGIDLPMFDVHIHFTLFGAIVIALLLGLLCGFLNGYLITVFSLPPFVVTLAMLTIARGGTYLVSDGKPLNNLGEAYGLIGSSWFLGIPTPVWVSAVLVGMFIFLSKYTTFGRAIYAIGGNEKASFLSGINITFHKRIVYMLSGLMAAIGGVILSSRLNSVQPNAGTNYELDAIAAVVIGGTSLSGGVGSIKGTVIGAIIIGVLNNGLVLLNVSPFWQQVVKGLVILLAVIIDQKSKKKYA